MFILVCVAIAVGTVVVGLLACSVVDYMTPYRPVDKRAFIARELDASWGEDV